MHKGCFRYRFFKFLLLCQINSFIILNFLVILCLIYSNKHSTITRKESKSLPRTAQKSSKHFVTSQYKETKPAKSTIKKKASILITLYQHLINKRIGSGNLNLMLNVTFVLDINNCIHRIAYISEPSSSFDEELQDPSSAPDNYYAREIEQRIS